MLPQALPAPEALDLTYRSDLGALFARWRRQPTAEELRAGYLALLDAAVAQQCPRWLIDARGRDDSNAAHTQWMTATFFPLQATRLRGPVRIAFLFAPSHLRALEADQTVPSLAYFDDKPYRVQRFIEEAAAVAWLGGR